jgi:hypothetical protein
MRGRHSAAMLAMIDMTATTGATIDEYVGIAVSLARDPAWHAEARSAIRANKNGIDRDRSCIAALEAFLDDAARREIRP